MTFRNSPGENPTSRQINVRGTGDSHIYTFEPLIIKADIENINFNVFPPIPDGFLQLFHVHGGPSGVSVVFKNTTDRDSVACVFNALKDAGLIDEAPPIGQYPCAREDQERKWNNATVVEIAPDEVFGVSGELSSDRQTRNSGYAIIKPKEDRRRYISYAPGTCVVIKQNGDIIHRIQF